MVALLWKLHLAFAASSMRRPTCNFTLDVTGLFGNDTELEKSGTKKEASFVRTTGGEGGQTYIYIYVHICVSSFRCLNVQYCVK